MTSAPQDGAVQLVGVHLKGEPGPHEDGGWPEFVIELRYLVRSDDQAVQEEQARAAFTEVARVAGDELCDPASPRGGSGS